MRVGSRRRRKFILRRPLAAWQLLRDARTPELPPSHSAQVVLHYGLTSRSVADIFQLLVSR